MSADERDVIWSTAWEWVVRERRQPFSESQRQDLLGWLRENPKHRNAYEEACALWLAAALIPPPTDSGKQS